MCDYQSEKGLKVYEATLNFNEPPENKPDENFIKSIQKIPSFRKSTHSEFGKALAGVKEILKRSHFLL